MELAFALDYIPRRMKELGYTEYAVRYRHLRVKNKDKIIIQADNHLMLAISPNEQLTISSKAGVFKWFDTTVNEQQYEHRGKITVSNNDSQNIYVLFIQVIPLHINTKKNKSNGRD
jgi:hypothetical protein